MHGLKNPKHEPVFIVVPKSGENGTGLCQKATNLAREKISVRKRQISRAFQSGSNLSKIEKIKEIDKSKEVYRVDWSK